MPKATVALKHLYHQDEHQIGLYFGYNTSLIEAVKKIHGARWSRNNRYWHVSNSPENLKKIFEVLKGKATI